MRPIDADTLLEKVEKIQPWEPYLGKYAQGIRHCMELVSLHIKDAPTIEPSAQSEQKIGKFIRWMEKKETSDYISFTPHCKCSLCGNELLIENINYCYMCGASLIEDREAERMEE